jgi:NitT/TauT family transport system substrate-binding protein
VVTKFLRATFQGWADAVENPQAIGSMVTMYNSKADAAFESASMVASLPYINTGEDHIGWMKPDTWAGMLQTMQAEGEVKTTVDINNVYTMEFIQKIYGESQS